MSDADTANQSTIADISDVQFCKRVIGMSASNIAAALGVSRQAALEKLRAVVPNGRDYYPQGPDAINTAQEQYWAMRQKLQEVSDELLEHAGNIVDAAGTRLVS